MDVKIKYKKGHESIILRLLMCQYKEMGMISVRKGKFTKTFKEWLSDKGEEGKELVKYINEKEKGVNLKKWEN